VNEQLPLLNAVTQAKLVNLTAVVEFVVIVVEKNLLELKFEAKVPD
jgi:hypothetical protein